MERQSHIEREVALDSMRERFLDPSLPLKIRKTNLLRDVGLPIPETDYFQRENLHGLMQALQERLHEDSPSLIVRVACIPERLGMPDFYISKADQIPVTLEQIQSLLQSEHSITHLIVQNATPPDKVQDKIVGRLLFHSGQAAPLQKTVELYKGTKNARILNNVSMDDPLYVRLEQSAGGFLRPHSFQNVLSADDLREITSRLTGYEEQLEAANTIIAEAAQQHHDAQSTSYEFSYREGRLVFVDIDY